MCYGTISLQNQVFKVRELDYVVLSLPLTES